jgi:PAS domain S-box-containing protein
LDEISQKLCAEGNGTTFRDVQIGDSWYQQAIQLLSQGRKLRVYGSDITALKRAQEELRETRDYLQNLIDVANAPIIVWNPEFNITRFNQAFERLTGLEASAILGKSLEILFPPNQRDHSMQLIRRTATGERWETVEIPIQFIDGSIRTVLWNSATLFHPSGNTPIATIAQGQDITERKRIEDALRLAGDELIRSNRDLEQFAYAASHDLQEPLRAVTGFLGLLRKRYQDQLDSDAQGYITHAVEGALRMQTLITDLLTYSRVGARKKPFDPTDMKAALDAAVENLQVSIGEARATVTSESLPTVMADSFQMAQLFQNLIGNAVKFRSEAPPQIHVWARQETGEWVFGVRDNGIGIEPQYFNRIFQIFQRLHSRTHSQGTGIGLALCKRIVERHAGRMWVESTVEKGSTFLFTIPNRGEGE